MDLKISKSFVKMITRTSIYLLLLLLANPLFAEKSLGQELKEVSIMHNQDADYLLEIFNEIENQTSFRFLYDSKVSSLATVFAIDTGEISLYDLLTEISDKGRVKFHRVNKSISVTTIAQKEKRTVFYRPISGIVTDEEGNPLPGASILEKGTANGTTTDFDGNFSLNVSDDNAVLVVSYVGFTPKEVPISSENYYQITLMESASALDEVVVIGYGTEEVAKLSSSVASISQETFKDIPITSVEQGFAGLLPGVEVIQASGRPGQPNQINIRGINTITAGTSPLIVVDGLPLSEDTGINNINPNDIESVEVLKDAASAAIYGSRGSNGVILITTKKGKAGQTVFSFDSFYGFQSVANKLDLMNAEQHSIWARDAANNYYMQFDDGSFSINDNSEIRTANAIRLGFRAPQAVIPDYILPYLEGQEGLPDTDWQDELFRTASIESYQVSASGGTELTSFYVSGNYFNQEGIVLGTDFRRISFRANLETQLSKKFKLGLNFTPVFSKENAIPENGFNDSPINNLIMALPYFPAYNPDGSLNISDQVLNGASKALAENPVAMALLKKDERKTRQLIGGLFLEYEFLKGLKAKSYLGVDYSSFRRETFDPSSVGNRNIAAPDIANGAVFTTDRLNWISESTIGYNHNFDSGHNIDALLGYSFQTESINSSEVSAVDFPNDFVSTLNAGVINGGSSFSTEWVLISYLGRARYDYKGKYLVSAAVRRDGSSRFGSNNRWGTFPSISAGYKISSEGFFPKNGVVSDLKVRASWGQTGNNQIGDFGSQALISGANYILDGNTVNGLAPISSPNANLGWETTTTTDLGLDFGLFGNALTANLDYYVATTEDLLLEVPVPAHSGFINSLQNIGKIENRGIEINLKGSYNLGPIKTTSTFNFVKNENEVLELGPGQESIITNGRHITRVGGSLGESYGYKVLGIFTSEEQIANTPSLPNAQVGEYIYQDSNGDGQINSNDRVSLGSIHPDFTYGFSTKFEFQGFDLSAIFQGVEGVHIHSRTNSVLLYNPESWGNGYVDYFNNYYTPERGSSAIYARPNALPTDNGFYRETDLLQENASFFRIRNITLGYSVPLTALNKMGGGLSQLRLYFSSKNPFTFTNYRGFNPEERVGNPLSPTFNWGNYPVEKSFVLGLNAKF